MPKEKQPFVATGSTDLDETLDRDEKVKIDLPFETTLRGLLKTPPEPPEKPKKR